jgi:hypothetical protein
MFRYFIALLLATAVHSSSILSPSKILRSTTVGGPPVADELGIRVAITDKGLKYVSQVAVPILEKQLSSVTIPDVPFDMDGFEGSLSAITCKNFAIGTMVLNANADPAASVALDATDVALSCNAKWKYKLKVWPHVPKGDGSVDISIGDGSAFSGTVGLNNNTGLFTSLSLPACTSNVKVSNLHFHGGISGDILNLFKSLITSTIEKEVNGQVCSAIKTALVTDANPQLAKPPADYLACTVLGKSVVCDVSLAQQPSSSTPPIPVPALPVPDPTAAPTHEILIMIDMTPINYVLYVVWDAGILDLIVTSDMIPSNFPQILNTSNFNDIAPGMFKKWPNLGMQLEINVTSAPLFQVITTDSNHNHTALTATLQTDIIFQVLDPDTGLENAFDVHCPFTASVEVDVMALNNQQSINASLHALDCTLSLVNTNVGNVSLDQLQGLVSLVVDLVEPMINKKLSNLTIPIPTFGSVNLTNSEIAFVEEGQYLLVATDVKLANGTKDVLEQRDMTSLTASMKERMTLTNLAMMVYKAFGLFNL